MIDAKPVTIVGGGLAGLALGIGLRRRQVPATILEAGSYPRHRVCGEFVSGRGEETLTRLGLMPLLNQAGGRRALTAALYTSHAASGARRLPSTALCLSRYRLDKLLADEFTRLGGRLEVGTRWQSSLAREGWVGAAGRQPARSGDADSSWIGLKAHMRNIPLEADLELHLRPEGYIGLCRLDTHEVNVCGLFKGPLRRETTVARKFDLLLNLAGPELRERLWSASVQEGSFCSVAGLYYEPRRSVGTQECLIGDCLALIPPFTGNGMSMAFEAAELALEPVTQFSQGQAAWRDTVRTVHVACRRRFARRLAWARALHRICFSPAAQRGLGYVLLRSNSVWQLIFALTR